MSTRRNADFSGVIDGAVVSSRAGATEPMLLLRAPHRNSRLGFLLCLCALLSGCMLQMFLRVERVKLDERLLVFLGGGGNSFAFLHDGVALISDPKFGPGAEAFRHDVEVELGRRVQRVLLTHWHWDHANGLALYDAPLVLVHPNAKRRLAEKGVRANWVEVDHEIQLTLGGEQIRVLSLGSGHTDGDLVALLTARKLLVAGDLVLDHWQPLIDDQSGGRVLALRQSLDRLLELDFERVLPGHGELMKRADVVHLRDFLVAAEAGVRDGLARGWSEETIVKSTDLKAFDDLLAPPLSPDHPTVRRLVRELRAEERVAR